ncbi:MAG: hypothetical protein VX265_12910 [Myxococcota bacterium]|nr:hypothetical protein [Myxococcota bacterium]MEC8423711.1 hypothetical protein [Myxococcota bacterium]
MRRLFSEASAAPDLRPALLSIVALMVLLLPLLLMTTSLQKRAGIALGVPGPDEELPPEVPGAVEDLRVERRATGYLVRAAVRKTDVVGTVGNTESKEVLADDLPGLQEVLGTFKGLDPGRDRITLVPAADTPTEEVVRWMDAVRAGPGGELFPKVILAAGTRP